MRIMCAKAYAAETGYPLQTLRKLCRTGDIPCEVKGRVYYFDADVADKVIRVKMETQQQERRLSCGRSIKVIAKKKPLDFLAALKAEATWK